MTIRLPITLALAAVAFAFPLSTDALGANVVPNPSFEQGGCGATAASVQGQAKPGGQQPASPAEGLIQGIGSGAKGAADTLKGLLP